MCQFQPRVHHVQPVRMEPPTGIGIAADPDTALGLPRNLQIVSYIVLKIIRINKILARVVRRIDIDQLDFARIAFLQQLEHFQVVAFDHQVLRGFPIDAFLRARAQGAGARGQRHLPRLPLAMPVQAIFLIGIGYRLVAYQGLEYIHIQRGRGLAFMHCFAHQFRKECLELADVVSHQVSALRFWCVGFNFLHCHGVLF